MAKKTLTKEELVESIAKAKTEIRQGENRVKQLKKENNELERKQRTNRLIQRGAILESMIKEPETLTNEQIKKLLQTAFRSAQETVRKMADDFRAENTAAIAAHKVENQSPDAS